MFLQIHTLTSYHSTLLNRDDAGLAKRIPFGGKERLRVSSQCLKRHWRQWMMERVDYPTAVRSRYFFSRILKPQLIEEGIEPEFAHELVLALAKKLLTAAKGKDALDKKSLELKQPILLGRPEAEYLLHVLRKAAKSGGIKEAKKYIEDWSKDCKKNLKAMLMQAGIKEPAQGFEGAMFGRFITSDLFSRIDAPVHVAHAFTTHALETEVDFFTVVDDLAKEEETGAAHAGDMELGCGIFYGYVAVDVPLLVSNLNGCRREEWTSFWNEDVRSLLELLIRAITTVSPGAKLGATAPYARAEHLVLEVGRAQPRSLANAYLNPIDLKISANPMQQSVLAMADYLSRLTELYGGDDIQVRAVASLHEWPREDERVENVEKAMTLCLDALAGGR